jgi:serine/threonine protein kinase/class 3 adenylate cyclase
MAELKTFLFTDICGSVRLKGEMTGRSVTERDLAFIDQILTPHRARIERELQEHGGRVVSTAGDGHFLVFGNTIQAAQWAVAVQQSHQDDPIKTPGGERVEVRISMHVGVPQLDPSDPNNFVGKSVDYAARLNDYATGGQILVSRSVMAILDDVGLEGLRLHPHGRRPLKGIGDVEVHELLYGEHRPRPMRQQPKSSGDRQWTVIPTQGFEGDDRGGRSGTAVASQPALKRVGNYELEELLGTGGMGDVYRARHTQFDRVRAVKVIKPRFVQGGHGEIVRRFYNEIKAVGRLEHKHIVVAIDSSSPTDQIHYLVMEYLRGIGLDDLIARSGPLPVPDACEIIRQAALGLQYIHKNDMVHRDVKPSNLMLTMVEEEPFHADPQSVPVAPIQRGVVKILDLGLALLVEDSQDRLTRFDNKAMGTGMYMSPEQWRTTSVDIRADIYSLGCTFYHLLAGNPPFHESDLRPEKAHEKSAVPPIRTGRGPVPRKLHDVIRKMMAKRADDRYNDPAEVARAIAPFTAGHDLPALFHAAEAAEETPSSLTRTHVDSSSRQDTWWSRARQGTGELLGVRDWFSRAGVPFLLVLLFAAAAIWMLYESSQRTRLEVERRAQESLRGFARMSAGTKLAQELALRFDILQSAAEEPILREQLAKIQDDPGNTQLWQELQPWLEQKFINHFENCQADSWFVNSVRGPAGERGTQVARIPYRDAEGHVNDSIGESFARRDYFHGQGRDLDPQAAATVSPIKHPNLSAVYRSSTSKELKVAFSVPVWPMPSTAPTAAAPTAAARESTSDAATPEEEPLGVLAMSVELGNFEVLEKELRGGNEVVLVDLREDYVEQVPKRGLILHHPRQTLWDRPEPPRVDPLILAVADEASSGWVPRYRDPLAENPKQLFWGAFERVNFSLKAGKVRDFPTHWIVVVQHEVVD